MRTETNEAKNPVAVVILAHGAGAGMDHPFMKTMAEKLADKGITVVRFNFPYMEAGKKFPGSPKTNIAAWGEMLDEVSAKYPDLPLFMAGKSYGGRMGSHLLAQEPDRPVKGIIYLGFPLHAPGKDSKDRAAHLGDIKVPQLFLQGTRDKLANIEMMQEVVGELGNATLVEIEDGDHSFKVPKGKWNNEEEIFEVLTVKILSWLHDFRTD